MTGGTSEASPLPLARLRVIERAGMVAGPYCGKLLREAGAEVVKVEPLAGDPARRVPPFLPGSADVGALFLMCNSRKQSATLDDTEPAGRELLWKLLDDADVFISDASMLELEQLELTPDQVQQRWPRLVFVSVRPYGLTGPYSDSPAHELDVFHSGGEGILLPAGLSYERFPHRAPVKASRQLPGYDSGWLAATLVTAALIRQQTTGVGDVIDLSQQEVEIGLNRVNLDLQLNGGVQLARAHRGYDFGGIFPCKDGYVTVRPSENRHWSGLATAIGRPDLAEDPRFADRADREANAAELSEILLAFFMPRTKVEIYDELRNCGAPVGYFADVSDVLEQDQFQARQFFTRVDVWGLALTVPGPAYQMSKSPAQAPGLAPALGEHTDLVFAGIGVDCARLEELRALSII